MGSLFRATTDAQIVSLLNNGSNIDEIFGTKTAFIFHCLHNHIECALALIKYGCNVATVDICGHNGLTIACVMGYNTLLLELLAHQSIRDIINLPNQSYNPLQIAATEGRVDIFDILIQYGADPNIKNITGDTPLMRACSLDRIDIIDKLLCLGANVNIQDQEGKTALFYCRSSDVMKRLMVYGVNLNIQDSGENTTLMHKIHMDESELIEQLIDYGADVNLRDNVGNTALMKAVIKNDANMVKILLNGGADINICNDHGHLPTDYTKPLNNRLIKDLLSKYQVKGLEYPLQKI